MTIQHDAVRRTWIVRYADGDIAALCASLEIAQERYPNATVIKQAVHYCDSCGCNFVTNCLCV